MALINLPLEIANTLETINDYDGCDLFNDVVFLTPEEKKLTEKYCSSDAVDFVSISDSGQAYLFVANDQTRRWTVELLQRD